MMRLPGDIATLDITAIDDVIGRLASTPRRLFAAIDGHSSSDLERHASPDEWSALDVLAHLRASDDIVSPRLLMVLTRDDVSLASLDERRWAEVAAYQDLDAGLSLQAFALRRAELVGALRRASRSDWERAGVHEIHGRLTLLGIARSLAAHEDEHCRQIEALLGRAIGGAPSEPR